MRGFAAVGLVAGRWQRRQAGARAGLLVSHCAQAQVWLVTGVPYGIAAVASAWFRIGSISDHLAIGAET